MSATQSGRTSVELAPLVAVESRRAGRSRSRRTSWGPRASIARHPRATSLPIMLCLDVARTAVVAIDMHRGHLDPRGGHTYRSPPGRCGPVIKRAAASLRRPPRAPRADRPWSPSIATRPGSPPSVLESSPRRPGQGPAWDSRSIPSRRARHGDRSGCTTARPRGARQETLQRLSRHRSRIRAAPRLGVDTRDPGRDQHHHLRALRRVRGDQPRLRGVVAADAVDSMDGEDMHRFALRLIEAAIGWPLTNPRGILRALAPQGE